MSRGGIMFDALGMGQMVVLPAYRGAATTWSGVSGAGAIMRPRRNCLWLYSAVQPFR